MSLANSSAKVKVKLTYRNCPTSPTGSPTSLEGVPSLTRSHKLVSVLADVTSSYLPPCTLGLATWPQLFFKHAHTGSSLRQMFVE